MAKRTFSALIEGWLDARYDAIVAAYPKGLTSEQFRLITLESADEADDIYPFQTEFFSKHSMLMRMHMDGVVRNRAGHNDPFWWQITDKGREEAKAASRDCVALLPANMLSPPSESKPKIKRTVWLTAHRNHADKPYHEVHESAPDISRLEQCVAIIPVTFTEGDGLAQARPNHLIPVTAPYMGEHGDE